MTDILIIPPLVIVLVALYQAYREVTR